MSEGTSPGGTATATPPAAPAAGSAPAAANVGAGDGPTPTLDRITAEPAGTGHVNIGGPTPADTKPATGRNRETVTATSRSDDGAPAQAAGDTDTTAGDPKTPPAKGGDWKVDDLPDGAQQHIRGLRDENAKNRKAAQEATAKAGDLETKLNTFIDGFSRVLGLTEDTTGQPATPPDPEKLTAQLDEMAGHHRDATVRLAVWEHGSSHGANLVELMDSAAFLADLKNLDPSTPDFKADLGKVITAAVERNPARFKVQPAQAAAAPVPSGGDFTGGPGGRGTDDIESMGVDDFRELRKKHRPS